MRTQFLLSILLLSFISCENYAVLVAGSNTYSNYRHQSNIFHHYHIFVDRGINPNNIVMMAYDDIANNNRNPFLGQIFNHPDGKNVYANIAIDYYGKDVTPENFIAVLTGDKDAVKKTDERTTGKVLTSTKDDNVYIYFSDHGSDNLIAFPSKYLYADELIDTFNIMYQKKLYKNLVFYLDASRTGSMFTNLPDNINIYAIGPNGHEGSSAEYCGSEATVNGTLIGSCLGDVFSCRFMEDIESKSEEELKTYTLQQQYEYLVNIIKDSIGQFGDLNIAKKSLYEFFCKQSSNIYNKIKKGVKNLLPLINNEPTKIKIKSENYRLEWYRMQAESNNDISAENEYYDEIMAEGRVTKIFDLFKQKFNLSERNYNDKVDFNCYREVVKGYENKCGTLIDRDFKFMTHIANFCTKGINPKRAIRAFETLCE